MGIQLSVTVRNARADAFETAIGTAAVLKIFTGEAPANCAASDSGTVLANATLPSDWLSAASSGQKTLSGTWQDASADNSGYAGHYRLYASDGTTCHAQGPVSQAWAGSTAYVLGQQVHSGSNVYVCVTAGTSASSGGVSGTGTSIDDGTVEWDYVDTIGMTMTNTNLAAGQPFSVTTFTITEGGA